jgi:hypothetical protein
VTVNVRRGDEMGLLNWPGLLLTRAKEICETKWGKRVVTSSMCIVSAALGATIYAVALFPSNVELWKKIAIVLGTGFASIGVLLSVIEKAFKIEVQYRDIFLKEKILERNELARKEVVKAAQNEVAEIIDEVRSRTFHDDSIFEMRAKHYEHEKLALAKNFVGMLRDRVRFLQSHQSSKIQIIIDSGSTLAPIFDVIGKVASCTTDPWSKEIEFFTNNIKGVQYLLKYREPYLEDDANGEEFHAYRSRYAEIPIKCSILPGKILSPYAAIADKTTIEAVQDIGSRENTYTISVTTGNYILLDGGNNLAVPIARAGYHPHMKAVLHSVAGEVYLVAPLGKILLGTAANNGAGTPLTQLNTDLGFVREARRVSQQPYRPATQDVFVEDNLQGVFASLDTAWKEKVVLVTTTRRKDDHVFFGHYELLRRHFPLFDPSMTKIVSNSGQGQHLLAFEFDKLPQVRADQIAVEIPHSYIREHRKRYFFGLG